MTRNSARIRVRSALGRGGPVLVFLAGPNGAGKSTFFRTLLQPAGIPFVNADEIAAGFRSLSPTQEASNLDELAFREAEHQRETLLASRRSFCIETVFSDEVGAKLDFLRRARTAGYVVFLIFIGLDGPQLSIARVMQRVAEGGHDIPDPTLISRFPRVLENLKSAIPIVSEAFVFDNSSDQTPFRPVAIYLDGNLIERFEPVPAWAGNLPGL